MIHRCPNCPGSSALVRYLNTVFNIDSESGSEDENDELQVTYQQWEKTDRAQIMTCVLPVSEFILLVSEKISCFTENSYLSRCQSAYLKESLANLPDDKINIQLDFAENYQFTVQDEIQSYHWTKTYCTVHPVVIHIREGDTVNKVDSLRRPSNDLSNDIPFVSSC